MSEKRYSVIIELYTPRSQSRLSDATHSSFYPPNCNTYSTPSFTSRMRA